MPNAAGEPGAVPSRTALKAAWRNYLERVERGEVKPALRVGLAASFTSNAVVPFLGAHLLEAGIEPVIEPGPFNQIFQVCLDPASHFQGPCDVIVVLWRLEDLVLEEILAFLQGDDSAIQRAAEKTGLLVTALKGLRGRFAGTIIAGVPPYPALLPASPRGLDNPGGLGALHRQLATFFAEEAGEIEGARLFDLDALQREFGLTASVDAAQWYLYRQPFSDPFLREMGTLLGRMVVALRRAPKKCLVLDCDNTLWGGIVGEDGVGGLQLGDEFPGSCYRDFQRLLLYWRQRGVLLALLSKNNEAEVWEVFGQHTGMVLKREHISTSQINWEPKSDNIPAIAKALNIGTDSLVFIDDNPMEIGYMQAARPEVTSLLLPEDPADIVATLRRVTFFDRLEITAEDRQRADMMRAEQQREILGAELTREDFLRELDLRLDFFRAAPSDLDRIAQLINKTNQFNLTTIRRTADEVRALAASPHGRIYGVKVTDKFGDYGLTGAVVVEISGDYLTWTIDSLLLSCRVLGRGVETALLSALGEEARHAGAAQLRASYLPTPKNKPAASFLPDHGFEAEGEGWHIEVAKIPPADARITLRLPL